MSQCKGNRLAKDLCGNLPSLLTSPVFLRHDWCKIRQNCKYQGSKGQYLSLQRSALRRSLRLVLWSSGIIWAVKVLGHLKGSSTMTVHPIWNPDTFFQDKQHCSPGWIQDVWSFIEWTVLKAGPKNGPQTL